MGSKCSIHVKGDFGTGDSGGLGSILLTKTGTDGEDVVVGSHAFLHVYDAVHLPQGVEAVLGEYVQQRRLSEVGVKVAEEVPAILEACAMAAIVDWANGGSGMGEEGWVGGKMMERLEGLLWGVWLDVEDEWREEDIGGGCWPS